MKEKEIKWTPLEEMEHILRNIWVKYHEYIMPQDSELTAQQFYFLKYVHHQHSCTPSDISKAFGITLGALTGFIDRLCKLELVTRSRTEEDRRLVLIRLTEKGRETLAEFEKQKMQKFALISQEFPEADVQKLNGLLKKLGSTFVTKDTEIEN